MPLSEPMHTTHGFFRPKIGPSVSSVPEKQQSFVDVGGTGDCGFRAIVATLIDAVLTKSHINADALSKLLTHFFNYFPQYRSSRPGLVTPVERMMQLVNDVPMGELIQMLAFTLRQLTVTELCKHPERYRGAFVEEHEGTSPAEMRKASTWIDESSIAAAAEVLGMQIKTVVVERGKTLPMTLLYNESAKGAPAVIQLQHGHYIPAVTAKDRFTAIATQPAKVVEEVASGENDPSLSEIHAAIAAEDKRLVTVFEEAYHRLATMVKAGEITKDTLLTMYVKGMSASDYLAGRVRYVGLEHGNDVFFNAILNAQQGGKLRDVLPHEKHDEQITAELVHALARAIAIGQMSADKVFEPIDRDTPTL
jgi:hypothetical protein